jgi:hypothetical protein
MLGQRRAVSGDFYPALSAKTLGDAAGAGRQTQPGVEWAEDASST